MKKLGVIWTTCVFCIFLIGNGGCDEQTGKAIGFPVQTVIPKDSVITDLASILYLNLKRDSTCKNYPHGLYTEDNRLFFDDSIITRNRPVAVESFPPIILTWTSHDADGKINVLINGIYHRNNTGDERLEIDTIENMDSIAPIMDLTRRPLSIVKRVIAGKWKIYSDTYYSWGSKSVYYPPNESYEFHDTVYNRANMELFVHENDEGKEILLLPWKKLATHEGLQAHYGLLYADTISVPGYENDTSSIYHPIYNQFFTFYRIGHDTLSFTYDIINADAEHELIAIRNKQPSTQRVRFSILSVK
jgi:hypothetical protein